MSTTSSDSTWTVQIIFDNINFENIKVKNIRQLNTISEQLLKIVEIRLNRKHQFDEFLEYKSLRLHFENITQSYSPSSCQWSMRPILSSCISIDGDECISILEEWILSMS